MLLKHLKMLPNAMHNVTLFFLY